MLLNMPQSTGAQERPFAYPQEGQSPEQQQEDDFECYSWASENTGFDPAAAANELAQMQLYVGEAPPAADTGSQGKRVAKGAARGTVVGTITGSTVRGA